MRVSVFKTFVYLSALDDQEEFYFTDSHACKLLNSNDILLSLEEIARTEEGTMLKVLCGSGVGWAKFYSLEKVK